MPRPKKIVEPMDADISDVTSALYPQGVPKNEDGSILEEGEIDVEDAQEIGAVTPESAAFNRSMAQKFTSKKQGKKVAWGSLDFNDVFNGVRMMNPSNNLVACIKRIGDPPLDYTPMPMSSFRGARDLFLHVQDNCHKKSPPATYLVRFTEGGQRRGDAHIYLGDTTQVEPVAQPPAWQSAPAPPVWQPPPPAPSNDAPPGWLKAANGSWFQVSQPHQQQQPAPPPQQQQMPMIAPPAGTDPAVAMMFQQMQEQNKQNQEQNARQFQYLMQMMMERQVGMAGPPPPVVPAAAPVVAAPKSTFDHINEAANALKHLQEFQKTVREGIAQADAGPEPVATAAVAVPEAPPVDNGVMQTVDIGVGTKSIKVAFNRETGKMDIGSAILGALPMALEGFQTFVQSFQQSQQNQAMMLERIERTRRGEVLAELPVHPPPQHTVVEQPASMDAISAAMNGSAVATG